MIHIKTETFYEDVKYNVEERFHALKLKDLYQEWKKGIGLMTK